VIFARDTALNADALDQAGGEQPTEALMLNSLTHEVLQRENLRHRASGGRSQENRCLGFRPAFRDGATGAIYPSCFADGRPAPCHLLDGLPDEVVLARNPGGSVQAVKASLVSGFVLGRQFYTREEAASWVNGHRVH
jgi:hypothetical protein